MSTFISNVQGLEFIASVQNNAGVPAYFRQRGFTGAIVDNGAGDYSCTLLEPCDLDTYFLMTTPMGATPLRHAVEKVSTTVIRIRMLDTAGAATDADVCVMGFAIGPN